MDESRLAGIPLFAECSPQERRKISMLADEVDVAEGKRLIAQGTFAFEFFVIEEGTADVLVGGEKIAELGPGDFLGEMGVMAKSRRNASVVATSPMVVIVMTARDLRHVEREMPADATPEICHSP